MQQLFSIARTFAFGPFLVIGFLVSLFVIWKRGREEYYDQDQLIDLVIRAGLWGVVAARLGFIVSHFSQFGFDVLKWFSLFQYPGYIGVIAVIVGLLYVLFSAKRLHWDEYEVADFSSTGLSLAMVFFYLGMFFNGSGFGFPTNLPVGIMFPGVFDKRHPTQLYAVVLYLILFFILWKLESVYRTFLWYRSNRRTAQSGFILAVFCIGYGTIGVLLSFFQPSFFSIGAVSSEAVIRAALMLFGFALLFKRSGRAITFFKKKPPIAST